MRNVRLRKHHKMPSVFLAVFSVGRAVEAFSTFVVAAFFIEYNAPVVMTSFVVTLGAGVLLSLLQDIKTVLPKLRKHFGRVVMNAILLSNSTICSLAGLKFSGAYRYLVLNFLSHAIQGPLTHVCGGRATRSTAGLQGGIVMLVSLTLLAVLAAYTESQNEVDSVMGFPKAAIGYALMLAAAVFEHFRMRYIKTLSVQKIGSTRSLHAVSVMLSSLMQLPLAGAAYFMGYSTETGMGTIQYVFMILFIMTFSIVFRFYVSGVGKRIPKRQHVIISDFLVSTIMGSLLDWVRGTGGCTMYSTCFVFAALFGLRLTVGKVKDVKDRLPMYNPANAEGK